MNKKKLHFKDIRPYIAKTDKVSILFPNASYQNYLFVRDVPAEFDDYIFKGIGIMESEFKTEDAISKILVDGKRINDKLYLDYCIEIFLEEEKNCISKSAFDSIEETEAFRNENFCNVRPAR